MTLRAAGLALVAVGAALAGATVAAGPAQACRLALTLGLDISSSVDAGEYRIQIEGLARALEDDAVRAAVFQIPGVPVALHVFEWSGVSEQVVIADWQLMTAPADLDGLAATLRGHTRATANSATGLGTALLFARGELARAPDCAQRKVDISGDGQSNVGIPPQLVYGRADFSGITVNGLAIQSDEAALGRYYRYFVIHGEGAFVEVAEDFDTYGEAIRAKLIRELGVPMLGGGPAPSGDAG